MNWEPMVGGSLDGMDGRLDGKELVKAMNAYTAESKLRSWWVVLSTLALFIGFEVAIYASLFAPLAVGFAAPAWLSVLITLCLRLFLSGLTGMLLVRLFVIYHDQQHGAILRGSRMGNLLMWAYGVFSLAANSVWRSSHNYHHQHNSKLRAAHIGSYPIMCKDRYESKSRGQRFRYLFMRHPLTMLGGYFFIFILGMCMLPFRHKPRQHYDCLLALLVHAALYVVVILLFGWLAAVFMIFIPFFVMSAACAYAFYAQHNFPDVQFVKNSEWSYADAALKSTSFLQMNVVMHWLSANIGYHHIHHLNARIPFYRLPEVMAAFPELQNPRTTNLSVGEVWRCLRLKVWDAELKTLVPLTGKSVQRGKRQQIATARTVNAGLTQVATPIAGDPLNK